MEIYLGKKDNKKIYKNLDELENIVMCGGVGSGKTTFIERTLMDIFNKNNPEDTKIIIFDSKKIDYFKYKESPFLLFPITSDSEIDQFVNQMDELKKIDKERIKGNYHSPTLIVFIDEPSILYTQYKNYSSDISMIMKHTKDTNIHFIIVSQRAFCLTKEIIDASKTKIAKNLYTNEEEEMMGVNGVELIYNFKDTFISSGSEHMLLE